MKSLRRVFGASFVFSIVGLGHLVIANPVGESVVGGAASFDRSRPGRLTINQATDRLIINWRDFSIGRGETTSFLQPSATSIAVNRVLAGNPSRIYGNLEANGIVYLINPNGILVGPSGAINTRTFVGSTLDAPDSSFMSGTRLTLSGNSDASVVNQGTIEAIGGDVFLVGRSVENSGTIRANAGTVGLGAGSEVMIVPSGNERLTVIAGGGSSAVGVNNQGTVEAVAAELKAAGGNIYALAINNGGIIRATGVRNENGRVFLTSDGGNIENSGTILANNADGSGGSVTVSAGHLANNEATVISTGTIAAHGEGAGTKGGEVKVLGDRVALVGEALVDVSGDAGGGTALIGGDFQGKNSSVQNARRTSVGPDAIIRADAGSVGDGGKVIVWADEVTKFAGSISARGGASGGNGGFAEVSGKQNLAFVGTVDLTSPFGALGTLLLDPDNITITDTADGTGTLDDELTPNADPNLLFGVPNDGANTVSRGQLEAFGNAANIVLSANDDITIDDLAGDLLNLAATTGSITFTADADNNGVGAFSMNATDAIRTQGGDVTITGVGIAVGSINTTPSTAIDGGNVSITSHGGGNITVNGSITTVGGPVAASNNGRDGGNVTLNAAGTLSVQAINASGSDAVSSGMPNEDGGDGGDISLTGGTGVILNGNITSSGGLQDGGGVNGAAGNLILSATAGGVNQAGGALSLGNLTLSGAGIFVLDQAANNIVNLSANVNGAITYRDANALTLINGVVSTDNAISISTVNGTLTVANDIAGTDVDAGTGTLSLTAGSTRAGVANENDNVLDVQGGLRGTGGITLAADNMTLSPDLSGINAGTASITLRAAEAGTELGIRDVDAANRVGLNATELGTITAGSFIFGQASGGNLSVLNDVNFGASDFTLLSGADILFSLNTTLETTGDATLTAGGNITGAATGVHVDADVITLQTTGSGDIGSSGTHFFVNGNSLAASTAGAAGNDIFVREEDGLAGLNLNAGAGSAALILDDGGVTDTDGAVDITAATATVTLSDATAQSFGSALNTIATSVGDLTVNSSAGGGSQFITEANGLTALNLNAGAGDVNLTLTLGGLADTDGAADITAANATVTLSDVTAQTVGALANRINTSVNSLNVDTAAGGGSQFIAEANGLTALNLNAGAGDVNLTLTLGGLADTDGAADITAANATVTLSDVTAQAVGAVGNRINTSVGGLTVDSSAGGGSQFVTEANGLTALNLNAGAGSVNLTLTLGGVTDADGAADITAANATVTLSDVTAQNVGALANRIDTSVGGLTVDTSAGGGSQFITEANGLTALNLNAGLGNVNLVLTAGSVADTDVGADITAAIATVTAAGFGAAGAGNAINTSVGNLSVNTSAANGSQFITEANGLSALDLNAGSGNVNLTLTLGGLQDGDGSTDITAAGTTITLSDAAAQNVGQLFNPIHTSVDSLAVSTAAGNGSMVIAEANGLTGLNLNLGAGSGFLALTAGSLLDTDGATDITSDGSVFVTVNGTGSSIGSAANPLGIGGAAGSASLSAVDGGVHVHANAAGGNDITFTSSTLNAGDITTEFSQPGKTYTVTYDNGAAGDLTVRGNGNIPTAPGIRVLAPGTLTLTAAGQIGGGVLDPLLINAGTFSASSGGNDISVSDNAGGLALGLVNAGAGAVNLTVENGDLTSATVDGTADLVGGAVNLTVTGPGSTIGASAANRLEINATTSLTAASAGGAGDGIFVQDTAGGLAVASVNAGAGAVNLNVVDGSLTSAAVDGNADIIGGNVTLAVSGAGSDIGAGAVNPLEINVATLSAATAGAAGDNIFVLDTAGGLAAGLITAGLGNVNLSVLNGALTSASVDGTADIVGDTVNLLVTGIGTVGSGTASRLEVNAETLRATTANNGIHIVDTAGGVEVDLVDAGSANVNLNALNGSITSANVDGTPDIIGAIVNLDVTGAGSDIGASAANRLEVNATTLSASTAGAAGDDIFLVDTAGGLTAGLITAGAGNVTLRVAGGSLIEDGDAGAADIVGNNVTLAVTGAGSDVGVSSNTRLEINAATLSASTDGLAGEDIFVVDLSGGLAIGTVDAGVGRIFLRAEGGNLTSANVDGVADVVGSVVNLQVLGANSRIGDSAVNRLEIDATTSLIAETDPTAVAGPDTDINILDTAGGLAIELVDAGAGDVNIRAVNGDITSFSVDGDSDLIGAAITVSTTGSGDIGASAAQPLEIDGTSLTISGAADVSVVDTLGGLTVNDATAGGDLSISTETPNPDFAAPLTLAGDIDAGGSVDLTTPSQLTLASGSSITSDGDVNLFGRSGLSLDGNITAADGLMGRTLGALSLDGSITAGAGQNIVLVAETLFAPVSNDGISLNVSGGGKWFIYSTSPQVNTPGILSVGGTLAFGSLLVNQLSFDKTFAANPPGSFASGEGNMVFASPEGSEDFDEIAKFFGDFIPVEDYRAVTISFGDYDPTKFGEVGDLWLSSSELYEEERKAGKAPRVAPEKIERMKFLIRGK